MFEKTMRLYKVDKIDCGHNYKIMKNLRDGVEMIDRYPRYACVCFRVCREMIITRLLKQFGLKITKDDCENLKALHQIEGLKCKPKFFERLNVIKKNGNKAAHDCKMEESYDELASKSFKATLKCAKKMSKIIDSCYEIA